MQGRAPCLQLAMPARLAAGLFSLVLLLLAPGCRKESAGRTSAASMPPPRGLPGAKLVAQPPRSDAEEWPTSAGDYRSTRYSPLDQIRPDNVKRLALAWRFDT